jgi:hypothetical protein
MVDFGNKPAVHIVADTESALRRMRATAEAAGCRIASMLKIETNPADLAAPGAAILIELESEDEGEAAVPLLDWLRQEAETGARRGMVSAPLGLVDLVAARTAHAEIEQLCEAEETERLAAVRRLFRPAEARLRDTGGESGARVLQRSPDYAIDSPGPGDAAFVRAIIRARRLRGEDLPVELFADPAWDMLLDLMAARLEGKKVAVSSLCIAAAVPPTTALRWIAILTERGLLVRVADPRDGRRAYIGLADRTARALGAWLRQARHLAVGVV